MAWDSTKPADTGKIRLAPAEITDNFKAIQNADLAGSPYLNYRSLQMADRTALAVAADPAVAASTCYIYSKQDGGGTQELYVRDAASNIIQVSNGGKIGSTATNFEADSVSFDGTVTYNEHNMFRAWGIVNAATTAFVTNNGFPGTVTNGGTGIATIDITGMGPGGADFATANDYAVMATAARDTGGPKNCLVSVYNKTATAFSYKVTWGYAASDSGRAFEVTLILLS